MQYFSQNTFDFLRELENNNNRDWFGANKKRYEEYLVKPAFGFIEGFEPYLKGISCHFDAVAKKVGGSLFRIYKDTRFSKDKTPYKTHIGIHFRHERAKDVHAPGFYLHLSPKECFVGAGIWHPASKELYMIREYLAENFRLWQKILKNKEFAGTFELTGDRLIRPPQGFAKEHPAIEHLKYKDFIAVKHIKPKEALGRNFLANTASVFEKSRYFVKFLSKALNLRF